MGEERRRVWRASDCKMECKVIDHKNVEQNEINSELIKVHAAKMKLSNSNYRISRI